MKLKITVGKVVFTATLYDNATTATLKARLPLHLTMRELNHNEKYGTLPAPLPTDAAHPGTIQAGDLMLYGDDTVVLFYQTFSTSYRYTRLGKLDDVTGLTDALGSGDVPVTLALE
ncbi:cyclophilin-like fold protein [Catalinimonas alkaloidigena]|nr:cyclophilin-like fold protein [Catalinimonas alkaloidigena]